eukprot:1157718-Pelagomonas_calceolata.AAC.7
MCSFALQLPLLLAGNYNEYFGLNTDVDAVVYLMLVNNLLHDVFPNSITIGEDVCCFRSAVLGATALAALGILLSLRCPRADKCPMCACTRTCVMAIADKWIETLKTRNDEDWDMGDLVHTLTNR